MMCSVHILEFGALMVEREDARCEMRDARCEMRDEGLVVVRDVVVWSGWSEVPRGRRLGFRCWVE